MRHQVAKFVPLPSYPFIVGKGNPTSLSYEAQPLSICDVI